VKALVVPSPLLGGAAYDPFVRALKARGHDARLADVTVGDGSVAAFGEHLAAQADDVDLLVPHSNSGRFAGVVSARHGTAVVYVDALLPDGRSDAAFVRRLVADDGLLPVWTEWWPAADLAEVVPATVLHVLRDTQPRIRPAFLLTDPEEVPGWREQPAAYLAFGDTYADEWATATAAGWPTRRLEGSHLHLLIEPDEVAAEVDDLARRVAP
jgi:hypothetical protein